jgi:glycosyltransferase involved in cell wall biosynthesis
MLYGNYWYSERAMDIKLNVCLLNDSFPPVIDGVANCVLNYAGIIQRHYGKAVVAVPSYPGAEDQYPFDVVRYPSINTTRSFGYRTGIPYWPASIRELLKKDIDVIHTHCPFVSTLIARMLRSYLNVPIVFTYHSKYDYDIKKAIALGFLRTAAISFIVSNIEACDEVWVVSEGAGENLRSLGYKGDYTVMRNGADFPRGRPDEAALSAVSAEYGLTGDTPVFLFVGRLMWYKNIRLILEGLQEAKDRGLRFKMVFAGNGTDAGEIRQLAAQLQLSEDCLFTGTIRDRQKLRALFCRSDLFLFPSTFDTNGLVVREAAACGLPSILMRGSAAAEGITDWRNGLLIDETPAAMADALIWAAANPGLVREMGQHAMDEITVSWEEAVQNAVRRYPAVIEQYHQKHTRSALYYAKNARQFIADIEEALQKLREYRERLTTGTRRLHRFK